MGRLDVVGRTDRSFCTRLGVVGAVLVTLAVWTHARPVASAGSPPDLAAAIPFTFGDWAGRDAPPLDAEIAQALAADQYVHRFYGLRSTGFAERVEVDIAYYARPHTGAAMHSPLNCLPGNGWQIVESRTTAVRAGNRPWDVRRLVIDRKGYRIAMAYWFQNRGGVIGHEFQQRLRLLTSGLQGKPTDAALVRVMALDTESGRRALDDFTPTVINAVGDAFVSRRNPN